MKTYRITQITVLFFIITIIGCKRNVENIEEAPNNININSLFKDTDQLIVVLTENWDINRCEIYLCDKVEQGWSVSETMIKGVTGKKGIAWGIGLHDSLSLDTIYSYKSKIEGDNKSPAGIFSIGKCYGYADSLPFQSNLEYTKTTENLQGVDDPESEFYNQIINIDTLAGGPKDYYNSFEVIKRNDDLYKWFFEIEHNPLNIPSKGSLIFFHIWKNESSGTAGCIATSEENILRILEWLDRNKNPKIMIVPKSVYFVCQGSDGYPDIL